MDAEIPRSVLEVLQRLGERGFAAYLVGGCVRDMVRGAEPKDFDVATSARPEQVQRVFPRTLPTGIEHGTVTVLSQGHPIEVTTFRVEGEYHDARRPTRVEFRQDVRDDLSRRDFTINAMAYDPGTQTLVDPFGGRRDLQAGVIRCVGEPLERFTEDGLRPLRAARFAAVLGFTLDPRTEAAMGSTLPSFRKVAVERVREELTKLLLAPHPRCGLELLVRTGLLAAILPELTSRAEHRAFDGAGTHVLDHALAAVQAAPPTLEVRLTALLHDVRGPAGAPSGQARALLLRLKFPNRTQQDVDLLVREAPLDVTSPMADADLRRLAARLSPERVEPLFEFLLADATVRPDAAVRVSAAKALRTRMQQVLAARPPLDGRGLALRGEDVMRLLGVGPSPQVGEATRFLVEQVLERPELNTPDGLAALLRQWAARAARS